MRHRPRRLDALEGVGDRGGLGRADEDRQDALAPHLFEEQQRRRGAHVDAHCSEDHLNHGASLDPIIGLLRSSEPRYRVEFALDQQAAQRRHFARDLGRDLARLLRRVARSRPERSGDRQVVDDADLAFGDASQRAEQPRVDAAREQGARVRGDAHVESR